MMRRRYIFFGEFGGLGEILSALNFEIPQHPFELILRRQAGVAKVAIDVTPVLDPAIVEQMQVLGDDEGDDAALQTLPEHQQPSDAAVAVLERVDALKLHVKIKDVIKFNGFEGVIAVKQGFDLLVYLVGRHGFLPADLVGQTLVVTHRKPRLLAVGGVRLQQQVQLFDVGFRDFVGGVVDDVVDAAEVVYRFQNVVNARVFRGGT